MQRRRVSFCFMHVNKRPLRETRIEVVLPRDSAIEDIVAAARAKLVGAPDVRETQITVEPVADPS